ncbi:biotin-[acetyl-CoA-carboxylase] ligase [Kwoniella mangroviensis CBS 10435]|uniref:Biotin-[acetyl-CoA-carboxylase] ligase n=1 Tax=Kwoniella mangroviensis CBS 10435 TaxID=1331196 RepID=A0A1B9IR70_9TREE|nr:biotin-[acetyl-CoA-carboxylase] ligase [Kwoniella mangroviensis CBS 10435]
MPGPSPSAHQVLVYSGPGVSPLSLSHTILTLSLLLLPHYTVQPATPEVLSSQPWEPSCALLIIPGGRDLPFVEELTIKRKVTKRIKEYVEQGGKYLGICAGAYFGTKQVKFDVGGGMEVVGERDLAFFPGSSEGPTFPGFQYASESGSRAVSLFLEPSPSSSSSSHRSIDHLYYNGGGHFVLPSPKPSNVEVLARYADTGKDEDPIAVVLTRNGKGKSILCSIHPEYPLNDPPARLAINKLEHPPEIEEIEVSEKERIKWVEELLKALDLNPPDKHQLLDNDKEGGEVQGEEDPNLLLHPTHPSPIFILSHPNLPELSTHAVSKNELKDKMIREDSWEILKDGNDQLRFGTVEATFSSASTSEDEVTRWLSTKRRDQPHFEPPSIESLNIDSKGDVSPLIPQPPDFHSIPKTILLPSANIPYTPRWTPLFNFDTYWKELDSARKSSGRRSGVMRKSDQGQGEKCALGDLVFYGETVTSTQTMLDRNPILLTNLSAPLAFLATFQLSGRGRGSNIWLSPAGCLQFSLLLDLPSSLSNKMVFIQYIMALAVCEAVDEDGKLGVRIKWPNDIYAEVEGVSGTEIGSGKKGKAKLGGILVNTNFVGGKWRIVVGCGINVLNALPTTSLSQLHSLLAAKLSNSNKTLPPAPTMEGTFAKIMNSFENKWEQFIDEKGFKGFMNEYHGRWLHSGQEVTLTTTEPPTPLRILSITPDHGLLRCIPIQKSTSTTSNGLTPLYNRTVDHSAEDRYSLASSPAGNGGGQTGFVDLQPDGNSFDLMSGLIKRKV